MFWGVICQFKVKSLKYLLKALQSEGGWERGEKNLLFEIKVDKNILKMPKPTQPVSLVLYFSKSTILSKH